MSNSDDKNFPYPMRADPKPSPVVDLSDWHPEWAFQQRLYPDRAIDADGHRRL